jgi:hypothetical protein
MIYNHFQECIDVCLECASICHQTATSCLSEANVKEFRRCIQLATDCADVCTVTAELMGRNSEFAERFSQLCVKTCNACALECERFASMNEYCKLCADACRFCAYKCVEISVAA